ncbi:hypothetical protein F383_12366 [Gossypium arboreum]|uniref:Uncharacterized protein n=1 Tax=Gossypium arboreum TaxID=29729 RepID=A0A0B0PW00_GOSAR|nr:hypothetical protein F383_12366 [Gossypium arboreum]
MKSVYSTWSHTQACD